jgi:hypothetical protein
LNNLTIYNDIYTTSPHLSMHLLEMNITLSNISEKERLFNLFKYLMARGHDQSAADLIDYMLRKKIIAKPL